MGVHAKQFKLPLQSRSMNGSVVGDIMKAERACFTESMTQNMHAGKERKPQRNEIRIGK